MVKIIWNTNIEEGYYAIDYEGIVISTGQYQNDGEFNQVYAGMFGDGC
jgi:hypothetical protein